MEITWNDETGLSWTEFYRSNNVGEPMGFAGDNYGGTINHETNGFRWNVVRELGEDSSVVVFEGLITTGDYATTADALAAAKRNSEVMLTALLEDGANAIAEVLYKHLGYGRTVGAGGSFPAHNIG